MSGLPTSGMPGFDIIAMRLTISARSVAASSEPPPSTLVSAATVDGSVPAIVIIDVRSSGSGSSPPRLTSIRWIAI